MLKMLFPHEYVESVFAIDYAKLYAKGYRGVIFDIDNTLVHHGEDSTAEVDGLFRDIHSLGLKTLLLSNNSEERISKFNENINTLYISDAGKPDVTAYIKATELLGLKKEETVYVGDQIFIDTYGANKAGIENILVKYMRYSDEKKIGIKRNLEKIVLRLYSLSRKYRGRIGDIHKTGGYIRSAVEQR